MECLKNYRQRFVTLYRKEAVTKTIPKEKKCKKAKWLSEKALQIAEKVREGKTKEERKYIYPSECRVPKNSKER